MFEHWDGRNSRLHHMFSDVSAWFYKALAGIGPDPEGPGFKRIRLRPQPVGDLAWARGEHRSLYGPIRSAWRKEGDLIILDVAIPPNTRATVHVPTSEPASVLEGGKPVGKSKDFTVLRQESGAVVVELGSGEYRFSAKRPM
jgi:alpha-L-rhamnosidase